METPEEVKWNIGINRYGWYRRLAGHLPPGLLVAAVKVEVARIAGVAVEALSADYDAIINEEVVEIILDFKKGSMSLEERLKNLGLK